jgi:peptide-methionine (S)-S-oxide reductase
MHRPDLDEGAVGSGYRSEIFYTSDVQRQVAEDTIAAADSSGIWHSKVVTKVSEAGPFWEAPAEDQNYLQHYPDGKDLFHP